MVRTKKSLLTKTNFKDLEKLAAGLGVRWHTKDGQAPPAAADIENRVNDLLTAVEPEPGCQVRGGGIAVGWLPDRGYLLEAWVDERESAFTQFYGQQVLAAVLALPVEGLDDGEALKKLHELLEDGETTIQVILSLRRMIGAPGGARSEPLPVTSPASAPAGVSRRPSRRSPRAS